MATRPDEGWRRFVLEQANATGFQPGPITEAAAPAPFSADYHTAPSFDVIDLLPEERKDLFRKLRQHRADAHRLIPEFETVRAASLARVDAENAVKGLTDHPQNSGRGLPETDPLVVTAKKHFDRMAAEFTRLQELQATRSAAFQSASAALSNVETWLKSGRPGSTTLEAVEIEPPPKLAKGEAGLLDQIEARRRRVRELRADLHRIASAPYPSSHTRAKIRQEAEGLALLGTPIVSNVIEHDASIIWPTMRVQSEVHGERRSLAFSEQLHALALFAWMFKDALIAALDREIANESDDANALSHEQRQQAEAETMSDLLATERIEAALTWAAMEQGLPVEFRSDISVLAILGIELRTVPRGETPETSAGYSWPWRR